MKFGKTRLGIRTGEALDRRILAYFEANPDEELSFGDIAAKFSTSEQYACQMARRLLERGELEHVNVLRLPPSARAKR